MVCFGFASDLAKITFKITVTQKLYAIASGF